MPRSFFAVLGVAAGLVLAAVQPAAAVEPSLVSLSAGDFDVLRSDKSTNAADFRAEYRYGGTILWLIQPWAGGELTSSGAWWLGGGFLADIPIAENWFVVPQLGVGYYDKGDGKDLGSTTEFREQAEIDYRFSNMSRLGLAFSHMSNASIGNKNPGAEVLSLYYHIPLSVFGG